MKKWIIAACLAATAALSGAGYYFSQHYVVLSEEDLQGLSLYIQQKQYEAFQIGKQVCKNTI